MHKAHDEVVPLDSIHFSAQDGEYFGKGHLFWNWDSGGRLVAQINRSGPPMPVTTHLRAFSVTKLAAIRARSLDGRRVLLPSAMDPEDFRLQFPDSIGRSLDLEVKRIIIVSATSVGSLPSTWEGSARFKTLEKLSLPHVIEKESRIQGSVFRSSFTRSGFEHDSCDLRVRLLTTGDDSLALYWSLDRNNWAWWHGWRAASAARWALAALTGQDLKVVQRHLYRGSAEYEERSVVPEVSDFRRLRMFADEFTTFEEYFVPLLRFFLAGDEHYRSVATNLITYIRDASVAPSQSVRQLIVGMALEAALRTLRGYSKKTWNSRHQVDWFKNTYLDPSWGSICDRVEGAFNRLRHRNAHPDWIAGKRGSQSASQVIQAENDMILLSRFYGYMVLTLAGVQPLQPKLPTPIQQQTFGTIRRGRRP